MIRNDYRRALIMLRSLLGGYGGHARIEVRTLAGTLSTLASIPQGERSVYAALVGSHKGKYFAAPLGALRRDMRGQGVMTATFDPRDIGGRPLDAYSLLTLVEVAGGKEDIAMVGNLNGNVDVDWGKAKDAACGLYRAQATPVSELLPEKVEGATEEEPEEQQENIIWDLTPAPEAQEEAPEEVQEEAQETPPPEEEAAPETEEMPPMEGEGWSFVKLPILESCGYPCSYIGVRSACTPEVICYALPARFTPEPPPGLDDYEWIGENGSGWWVYCQSPAE